MSTHVLMGDLNAEQPYLMNNIGKTIDVPYLREKGELIHSFPAELDSGEVDRYAYSYVLVALTEDGKQGYLWDVVEAENREQNYRRMRNGMNLSIFSECDFYFLKTPAVSMPNVYGAPAIDRQLYAPFFNRER